MEFTNTFTIPVGVDEAYEALIDLERVAPCMPGAKLESVDGDTYEGRMKVKVGPMSLTYRGTAEVVDKDPEAHTARISAKGSDSRGGGTANADVSATLTEVADGTEVTVVSAIDVTGKPAQFGRGVMADVGEKIIEKFSDCLARRLGGEEEPAEEETAAAEPTTPAEGVEPATPAPGAGDAVTTATPAAVGAATQAPATGPRTLSSPEPETEALDLMEVAGGATARRLLPVLAALTVVGLVIWLLRRRRR